MQEIIFRTNYGKNIGLGHLYRCLKLANELKKYYKIIFVIDRKSKISDKIINFEIIELYKNSFFKNQIQDAHLLKNKIGDKNIRFLIIDDYRLNFNWEKIFFNNYQIVVFDDINKKKHKCHFIIDSKWTAENTEKRYKTLVPKTCTKLLGPKYAMINKKLNKFVKKKNFLLYFGGSSNLSKYENLILELCIINKSLNNKIRIDLVIGPMAYNYNNIINYKKKFNFLNIIRNKFDLSMYLNRCKFAFSTSSSIIYELNYLNIPSCLFSTSENQKNETSNLEDLGFYLNINLKNFLNSNKREVFFKTLLENLDRVNKLSKKKKVAIDNYGANRIVYFLNYKNKKIDNKITKIKFSPKKRYSKVDDTFINKYLEYRNMFINRKKSLNQSFIQPHDHYIWWFNKSNMIEKYLYFYKKNISIFYHQKIKINGTNFWYGGWMTCDAKPNFFEIINFLKFQLKISFLKKKLPWIAIIKKNNKFVYLINKKIKFRNIKNQVLTNKIKKYFKISKSVNYHFLTK